MNESILFSIGFMVVHTVSYMVAGVLALRTFSKKVYEGKTRVLDFQRDVSLEGERRYIARWLFPSQLLRGLLMSVVLYPLLNPLMDLPLLICFAFFFGLFFVFTHVACAAPCSDNIEGFLYMKPKYFDRKAFWKFQWEMALYSALSAIGLVMLIRII